MHQLIRGYQTGACAATTRDAASAWFILEWGYMYT